jgi:hypothetical protein
VMTQSDSQRREGSMRDSFSRKFILVLVAGFSAACLLFFYRHFVVQAIHDNSNEGWRDMFQTTPAPRR